MHPVTGVTGLHAARYARQLDAAGLSPASAARKLAAVSGWYAWLAQRGHIAASPAAGIARPRADPGSSPPPALTRDQALALIRAADTAPGPQRARTAALVAVLLFTGARVSEVIGADAGDLGTEQGHRVLRVTRANGRRQSLALPGPAASRIDAYLAGRPGLRGVPVLFATRTGGRLFAADVRQAVRRLATRAELPADLASHLGPRMMRHSFAALYLDAGRSFRDLQSAMGYADPRTTRRYDQARHIPVIHLARPQQRHRAPPQPQEPPQPAARARVPGPGPWPGGRPHCRARQPQPSASHPMPHLHGGHGERHRVPDPATSLRAVPRLSRGGPRTKASRAPATGTSRRIRPGRPAATSRPAMSRAGPPPGTAGARARQLSRSCRYRSLRYPL